MNVLTQEEIDNIRSLIKSAKTSASGAILLNAETICSERTAKLRAVKELMDQALFEIEDLEPMDSDSIETSEDRFQSECIK